MQDITLKLITAMICVTWLTTLWVAMGHDNLALTAAVGAIMGISGVGSGYLYRKYTSPGE